MSAGKLLRTGLFAGGTFLAGRAAGGCWKAPGSGAAPAGPDAGEQDQTRADAAGRPAAGPGGRQPRLRVDPAPLLGQFQQALPQLQNLPAREIRHGLEKQFRDLVPELGG